jgi:hypothetical protein
MKSNRKGTKDILIDIAYQGCMNKFEEFYGFNVTYQELEQRSYVELKEMLFKSINDKIKFRKYGRIGQVLTIKAEMFESELNQLIKLIEEDKVRTIYDWTIKDLTIIKEQELN